MRGVSLLTEQRASRPKSHDHHGPGGRLGDPADLARAAASLAGPAATLIVLLVLALTLNLWARVAPPERLYAAVAMLAFLQATALILNLLPLPGLDGFNALRPFLPKAWAPAVHRLEGLALLILLGAVFFIPGFSAGLFAVAVTLAAILGVSPEAMQAGWDAFHFWR